MNDSKESESYPGDSCSGFEDVSLVSAASSKSKFYFNAIDKAHEILEHDEDLAKTVPSCVVVGMQSVGKSAILSRISGICFPQDSELCTRVAIELRMRRARNYQDAPTPMVIKAGSLEAVEVDASDDDAVENALTLAQKNVLNGREFEDKLSVKVEKEDTDLPEVTLIDLPGVFFAKDNGADELEAQVKNMIEDRVRNEMALILHVVPLNQDTDTISTWRTVRDADASQKRTISVLTKADLAVKDENGRDKLKKRIQKILKDSNSSECFVVHGAAKTLEDEESQLSQVSKYIEELDLGEQIKVGLKELNEFIEERMLQHIKDKIPEMKRLLHNELSRSEVKLKILGRQTFSPISIAVRESQRMKRQLTEAYELFQPDFRRLTEKMSQEIFNIDMAPLGWVDVDEAKQALSENLVYEAELHGDKLLSLVQDHHLALEAKYIGEYTRPMINTPYVGKRSALVEWLENFVEPLETILKEYIDEVFDAFDHEVFHPSILEGSSESIENVTKHLELQIKKNIIVKAKSDAVNYADYLVDSVKKNMFTSNDHYLSDTTKQLEDGMRNDLFVYLTTSYQLEMQMHFFAVCGIRAFLKTRKKLLPDAIQLHITKAVSDLFEATEKEIGEQMLSTNLVSLIKESTRTIATRKFHLEREKKIGSALDEISLL